MAHDVRIGLIGGRRGDTDVHACQDRGQQQRMAHVVAIADEGQCPSAKLTKVIGEREEIGQGLARMLVIGQRIHDRDR